MASPRIAIVGAPNVGKSTLFNRLVRRRRSLVAGVPGLTRDLIEADATLGGLRATLVDTGGLMPPAETPLQGEIRRRVLSAAKESDLLLFVVDARAGLTSRDEDLAGIFRRSGRPVILVVNKADGPRQVLAASEFARLGFDRTVCVSAEHGGGMTDLGAEVARVLPGGQEREQAAEIRVAIAGRPNVGKSSLLNAMLASERALVSETPGTTRDPVDAFLERGEKRYRLVDTAGLRRRGRVTRGPEALSGTASRRALRQADVTLVLLDASEGLVAQDAHVLGMVAGGGGSVTRPAVVLLNKIDLLEDRKRIVRMSAQVRERLKFARFVPVIPVSALKRLHLDRVFQAIDGVYAESCSVHPDGRLNDWLRKAVARHPPPAQAGKPVSYVYISQADTRPPTFTILTNRDVKPHFSYVRYLENSLRAAFGLKLTPVVLRFRKRSVHGRGARRGRPEGAGGSGRRRKPRRTSAN